MALYPVQHKPLGKIQKARRLFLKIIVSPRFYVPAVGAVLAYIFGRAGYDAKTAFEQNLYTNLCASMIIIVVTVALIEWIFERQTRNQFIGSAREAHIDILEVIDNLITQAMLCFFTNIELQDFNYRADSEKQAKKLHEKMMKRGRYFKDSIPYDNYVGMRGVAIWLDELSQIRQEKIQQCTYANAEKYLAKINEAISKIKSELETRGYALKPEARLLYLEILDNIQAGLWFYEHSSTWRSIMASPSADPNEKLESTEKLDGSEASSLKGILKTIIDARDEIMNIGY
jgi:hypothetical protein